MRRDVFQAIADPTRREIIGLLAKESLNLNAVAEKFDISRPAISKHIKMLTECGIIVINQKGREDIVKPSSKNSMKCLPGWSNIEKFGTTRWMRLNNIFINFKKVKNMGKENSDFYQDDNQLVYTRLLNAPRDLVWEAWTNPDHIKEWWGPNGFSLTHQSIAVKPGGEWNFIMHGLGQDFENRVKFIEVIEPSFLSYQHGNPDGSISFMVNVNFDEADGKTLLTMRSVFESAEVIAELNRTVKAIEGGMQHLDRLKAYVDKLAMLKTT